MSITLTSTPSRALISTRPPGGVWRMALPTRFESTRPSCSGSKRPRRPGGHSRSSCTCAAARVGGIQREAVVEQRLEVDLRDIQRHDARIEAREVEQVVDEQRHALDLNLQRREVQRRIADAVLERLGCRAQIGERRAQVVARCRHELALRAQEPVERGAHLVDDGRDLAQLGRPADRGARLQLTLGEALRGAPQRAQRQRDGARDEQRPDERRGRGGSGDSVIRASWRVSNMISPEATTATSGRPEASSARPASRRRRLGRSRRASPPTMPAASEQSAR